MSNQNNQDQAPSIDETNDLIAQRQAKLDEIAASGKWLIQTSSNVLIMLRIYKSSLKMSLKKKLKKSG